MADLVALLARFKPAVVAIVRRTGDGPVDQQVLGTGFNIDQKGVIVTCRHVVEEFINDRLEAQFVYREEQLLAKRDMPFNWVIIHDTDDVAIIRLQNSPMPLPFAPLGTGSRVSEGTAIGVCGYPLGLALEPKARSAASTFQVGIVGAIMPYPGAPPLAGTTFYRLDIPLNFGNSGGPMFLQEDGAVVGVVAGRPTTMAPVFARKEVLSPTDLTAIVSGGLTHAIPIDRSLHLIERVKRLTDQEIDEVRRTRKFPPWWDEVKTPA
ncbi:MAG: serine protease [Candidatus Rokubacteria bacterium]|nr:serine protease [Candidatus Rokubacteria bacterium]